MKDEKTSIDFSCPKCGSFMFGSSDCNKPVMQRHCHGNEEWKCDFTFPSTDDWKYFVKSTTSKFESPEEYEQARESV